MIKIRLEISETENWNKAKKINKTKSWFLRSQENNSLARMIKKRRLKLLKPGKKERTPYKNKKN